MKYVMPIAGAWATWTDEEMARWKAEGRGAEVDQLRHEWEMYRANPLRRALPHGVAWHGKEKVYELPSGSCWTTTERVVLGASRYPRKWKNDGVAFVNDWTNDYLILLAPRKTGKTFQAALKFGLWLMQCDPEWPVFREHGVEYIPWTGPKVLTIASLSWTNTGNLWDVYREVLPASLLGEYRRGGKKSNINWKSGNVGTIELTNESLIVPQCYSGKQRAWESIKSQALHADEQTPLNLLRAWEDGASTYGDYTPVAFTLSAYVLADRPDTGAAGPLKRIWDGVETRAGKKIGRYNLDVESTPECILSAAKKKERWDRYVNPDLPISQSDRQRGVAVYYPGWESRGGLCFGSDVWDRKLHVINPLWEDDKAPKDWTKWRVLDYCDNETTAVVWCATGPVNAPNGRYVVSVCYRTIYERQQTVSELVRNIIEMSHNTRHQKESMTDEKTEVTYQVYSEDQTGEQFYSDLLDSRVAPLRRNNMILIDLMRMYGLENLREASGDRNSEQIPLLKDKLRIDYTRPHPWARDEAGKPVMGCPGLFFFDGRCEGVVAEIEGIPADAKHVIDLDYPHDGIDALKYWASDHPCYMGDGETEEGRGKKKGKEEEPNECGY